MLARARPTNCAAISRNATRSPTARRGRCRPIPALAPRRIYFEERPRRRRWTPLLAHPPDSSRAGGQVMTGQVFHRYQRTAAAPARRRPGRSRGQSRRPDRRVAGPARRARRGLRDHHARRQGDARRSRRLPRWPRAADAVGTTRRHFRRRVRALDRLPAAGSRRQ